MRLLVVLALFFVVAAGVAHGAGECGSASADSEALRLEPCIPAGKDPQLTPASECCSVVRSIGKRGSSCLCAVMLSHTARDAGIKPDVAITIPKRCNMADRPVGYNCGGYKLP